MSRDIDGPDKYEILKSSLYIKRYNVLENIKYNFFKLKVLRNRLLDKSPNDFWLFPEILEHEEKLGFRSTFFFASANKFQKYSTDFDVDYDINRPNYKKLIQEIKGHGFEVSLHASYNAFLDPNRLLSEKNKLERVSGFKIRGLRHHYWHMNKNVENTLEHHERCGFEYDTSIAFNDELGFRRNIALPYYPWSDALSRPINVVQLPVFCMDGNLFYKPIKAEDAVEKLSGYIEIIKKYGGLGVIDWHDRTSYPKNKEFWGWGEVYIGTLNYLHNNPDIWVTNLGSIASWIKKRESILKHI